MGNSGIAAEAFQMRQFGPEAQANTATLAEVVVTGKLSLLHARSRSGSTQGVPQTQTSYDCDDNNDSEHHGSLENGGNMGSLAQLATDTRGLQLLSDVEASRHRIGRPPNTMRLPMPGTTGSPSIYGWRETMITNAKYFEAGAKVTGGAATVIDGYLAIDSFRHGNPIQGSLDLTSALSGAAMFWSFEATAPVSVPVLFIAKSLPVAAKIDKFIKCHGGDSTYGGAL